MIGLRLRGVTPLWVLLCAFAFAGQAGAGVSSFQECVDPNDVPDHVLTTLVQQAGFDFGDSSEQTCNHVASKGASTCKAQVKGAAKCLDRALDGNYDVGIKQCNQLDDPDKSDCKDEFKTTRQNGRAEVDQLREYNLGRCGDDFEIDLFNLCLMGIP
jgi:hypothetical protein